MVKVYGCNHIAIEVDDIDLIVRDEAQITEIREKLISKYGITPVPPFRCDSRDPFGNRVQVVDLHDESMVWLLPYRARGAGCGNRFRPRKGDRPNALTGAVAEQACDAAGGSSRRLWT